MAAREIHPAQQEALRVLLEYAPDAVMSMIVDHQATCLYRAAAETILTMVGWTRDDLASAFIEQWAKEAATWGV